MDEADRLIHLELHESEIAELGHPCPGIVVQNRHTKQPVIWSSQMRARARAKRSSASAGSPPICRSAPSSSHGR